jgi:hypothetical protein
MLAVRDRLRDKLGVAQRHALRLRIKRSKAESIEEIDRLDREIRDALQAVWDLEGEIDRQNGSDSDF